MFGLDVKIKIMKNIENLPIFLTEEYDFYLMEVLGLDFILLKAKEQIRNIPQLKKHLAKIKSIFNKESILWTTELTNYQIRSLIKSQIQFVLPGKQVFAPKLGLAVQEKESKKKKTIKKFPPSTQLIFLLLVYNNKFSGLSLSELAYKTGINNMTISRGIANLKELGLVEIEKIGVEKRIYLELKGLELFVHGREYLNTPFRKKIYVNEGTILGVPSGTYALSKNTMLATPPMKTFAVYKDYVDLDKLEHYEELPLIHKGIEEIELWLYDPTKVSQNGTVDPISLYAYNRETGDERIEIALEEYMGGYYDKRI